MTDKCLFSDNVFKILIIGEPGVGKSSLADSFTADTFKELYQPTIGADFQAINVETNGQVNRLFIWDTSGHKHF